MKPRWLSTNAPSEERFFGYVGEFDLYFGSDKEEDVFLTLIAEAEGPSGLDFDIYAIENGALRPMARVDLHLTPYHMCLLYAAAVEHGVIKEQENGLL